VTITRAPASASAAAIAAPRPLVAPVTRTRMPFSVFFLSVDIDVALDMTPPRI